ncbi:MAG: fumarate hydratase C-terminal domain-containing protein [Thermoplasmata archaeon]|nr:fumarate hydratase C-terminal domain-containing protein [Thermoplasmata archaeon]
MEVRLKTPLSRDQTSELRVGDVIYLSGRVWTARDEAHKLLLEGGSGNASPEEGPKSTSLEGGAIYHCGPLARMGTNGYELLAAGPTTSIRMEEYTPRLLKELGIRLLIGKGGMGSRTMEALKETGAAYASFLGGGGALGAELLSVADVHYLERLGMAEAVWVLDAKAFGPLMVTMDSTGSSIYGDVRAFAEKRMAEILSH